jgi:hypothetical protein
MLSQRADISPSPLTELHEQFHANNLRRLVVGGELNRVLAALTAAGIRALPLKGVALAAQVYATPELRQPGDLDLWVEAQAASAAGEVLHSLGYRRYRPSSLSPQQERAWVTLKRAAVFSNDDLALDIDLHWGLSDPHLIRLDFESLWQRSTTTPVRGKPVRVMGIEDTLIFLCLHAAQHDWTRLKWLMDIAELLRNCPLDEALLLSLAERAGARRVLLVGAALAARVLKAPLPPRLAAEIAAAAAVPPLLHAAAARLYAELGEDDAGRRAFLAALGLDDLPDLATTLPPTRLSRLSQQLGDTWGGLHLLRYQSRPRWQKLLLALAIILTPGESEIRRLSLPPWLYPLYVVLRVARLLREGVGTLER